jgi:5-(carboxyamino)imidazole ribonucleotide synthase
MMTIGILGGGQLGLMMAQSAKKLGHKIVVLDPHLHCPCASIADLHLCAAYNDAKAFKHFVDQCDVCTYEFENADAVLVSQYESKFPQGSQALKVSSHRFLEKNFARQCGFNTPDFFLVQQKSDLNKITSFPVIIKTCRFGYDGKGQWLINNETQLNELNLDFTHEYIVESFISWSHEISVIVSRSSNGVVTFPPFENTHIQGILSLTQCPSSVLESLQAQALQQAQTLIQSLDYYGVLAVEFFIKDDQLIFNEFAPRPHNSGHCTIECFSHSQFDVHVAAITKSLMPQPIQIHQGMMINILGQHYDYAYALFKSLNHPHLTFHDYGKKDHNFNRKVAHITSTIMDKDLLTQFTLGVEL